MLFHQVNAHLRTDVFYLSIVTLFFVFILLLAALLTFKKPVNVDADGGNKNIKWGVELVWALIPFVMLFVMLIPIVRMAMN